MTISSKAAAGFGGTGSRECTLLDTRQFQSRFGRHSTQKRWVTNPPEKNDTGEKKKPSLLSKLPLPNPVRENIYTIPNLLTFSRLLAAPAVGYLLVHHHHAAALSLFAYAGITDLVDGYIARRYNLQTVVGTIIDPAADKLLMTVSVVCLALNGSMPGIFFFLFLFLFFSFFPLFQWVYTDC